MLKNIIYESILFKNKISENNLFDILSDLYFNNNIYSEIYFQNLVLENFYLENRILKNNFLKNISGLSVRIVDHEKTYFSYSNEISLNSLIKCVNKVKLFCLNKIINKKINLNFYNYLFNNYENFSSINFNLNKSKIDLLLYLDNFIRKKNLFVNYVGINLVNSYEIILIVSSDDIFIGDVRPLVNIFFKVQVEKNYNKGIGICSGGGRYSYENLLNKIVNGVSFVEYLASESLRIAENNLNAIVPSAGSMPVVLGSGSPGVLFHEAVGHGLEGDFIRKKSSIYSELLNKKVASSLCTVVDDGTVYGLRGSLNIDDEGVLSKKNILIENGILKSFMFDKLNSKLLGFNSTGNSRRESYAHLPLPRMTNTYLLSGKNNFNDLINSIDYGLYIVSLLGGQVDITSGKFVFTVLEGYLIKNGLISKPIKNVTLIGSGINVMNNITMVANDLKFDYGSGTCGKDNQNIPVGIGQPSLKISSMIVGGIN